MKYYLITTGLSFILIFIGHIARAYQEGVWVFSEPIFLASSILSIGFCLWFIVLYKKLRQGRNN